MLESLVVIALVGVGLVVGLIGLLVLGIKLLVALVLIPVRILVWLFAAAVAGVAGLAKAFLYIMAGLFGILLLAGGLLILPLVPLLLIGLVFWMVVRLVRGPAYRPSAARI